MSKPVVKIQSGKIAGAIKRVSPAVKPNGTNPLAKFIIFDTDKGRIWADDGSMSIICKIDDLKQGNGRFAIEGAKLAKMVGAFDAESLLTFKVGENEITLSSGRSRYKFQRLPDDQIAEPPKPQDYSVATLQKDVFTKSATDVLPFCATKDVRAYLNGMFVELEEGAVKMTGTNGHALSHVHIEQAAVKGGARKGVVKTDGLRVALSIIQSEWVHFVMSDALWALSDGDVTVVGRYIEGKYPDYQTLLKQVEARESVHRIQVKTERLRSVIERVKLFVDGRGNVVIESDEQGGKTLAIKAISDNHGVLGEDVLDDIQGDFQGKIGFNIRYLDMVARTIDGDAFSIDLPASQTPHNEALYVAEQGEGFSKKQLVMPVRL